MSTDNLPPPDKFMDSMGRIRRRRRTRVQINGKPEKRVEDHLVKRAKEMGGIALKLEIGRRPTWPDRIVILPNSVIGFAELKAEKGRLTMRQQRRLDELTAMGHVAEVLWSIEGVDGFLERLRVMGQFQVTQRLLKRMKEKKQ